MQRYFKKFVNRWLAASLFAVAMHFVPCTAAGEEPPPPPPPPPAPLDPAVAQPDKPVTTNALDVDYVFDDNGRRDPFTFTKNVAELPGARALQSNSRRLKSRRLHRKW